MATIYVGIDCEDSKAQQILIVVNASLFNSVFHQRYGKRIKAHCTHTNGFLYAPPTTGSADYSCGRYHRSLNVEDVQRFSLLASEVPKSWRVVYHGIPFYRLKQFSDSRFQFTLNPPNGSTLGTPAHGRGIYLTPSFTLALGYAFVNCNTGANHYKKFTIGGESWGCAVILQCAVNPNGVEKKKCTAWSEDKYFEMEENRGLVSSADAEWLCPDPVSANILVYGVLACWFRL
jgi:hypothetical protein